MSVPTIASNSPDANTAVGQAINSLAGSASPTVYTGATDAILFPNQSNLAVLTPASGVDAATLATPTTADNGKLLRILNGAAQASTVTTASGKILDGSSTAKNTVTFAAHIGATIELVAYNGFWNLIAASNATLSAV